MNITTTQKLIKIGSSRGITVPAKILRQLNATENDEIEVEFKAVRKRTDAPADKVELVELTQKLIKRHEKALKNLADR